MEFGERRIVPSKKKQTKKSQSTNADYKKTLRLPLATSEKYMKRIIYVKNNRKYLKINKEFILLSTFKKQKGGAIDENIFDDLILQLQNPNPSDVVLQRLLDKFKIINQTIYHEMDVKFGDNSDMSEDEIIAIYSEMEKDVRRLIKMLEDLKSKRINYWYQLMLMILIENYINDYNKIDYDSPQGEAFEFLIRYCENEVYEMNILPQIRSEYKEYQNSQKKRQMQVELRQPRYLLSTKEVGLKSDSEDAKKVW